MAVFVKASPCCAAMRSLKIGCSRLIFHNLVPALDGGLSSALHLLQWRLTLFLGKSSCLQTYSFPTLIPSTCFSSPAIFISLLSLNGTFTESSVSSTISFRVPREAQFLMRSARAVFGEFNSKLVASATTCGSQHVHPGKALEKLDDGGVSSNESLLRLSTLATET